MYAGFVLPSEDDDDYILRQPNIALATSTEANTWFEGWAESQVSPPPPGE